MKQEVNLVAFSTYILYSATPSTNPPFPIHVRNGQYYRTITEQHHHSNVYFSCRCTVLSFFSPYRPETSVLSSAV